MDTMYGGGGGLVGDVTTLHHTTLHDTTLHYYASRRVIRESNYITKKKEKENALPCS